MFNESLMKLRGISCLLVVVYHFFNLISYHTGGGPLIINLGMVGVCIFFSISGYLIPFSLERYGVTKFLLKRTLRIFPTAITALFIIIIFYMLFDQESLKNFSVGSIALNFLLLAEITKGPFFDGVYWTLTYELLFYVYLALFYFMTRSILLYLILNTLFLFFIKVYFSIYSISASHDFLVLSMYSFGCFFNIGLLLFILNKSTNNKIAILLLLANLFLALNSFRQFGSLTVFTLFIFELYLIKIIIFPDSNNIFYKLNSLGANYRDGTNKLFIFFGTISFPFYLIHNQITIIIFNSMLSFDSFFLPIIILCFIFSIFLASLLHKYIELPTAKIKLTNF
jgi:peptidoglycan/LPS O-acetylase OafA/YrhL